MKFSLPKSNFPVISSYRGRISRILLVDDVLYDGQKPYVLENQKEIIALMAMDETRSIHFDILVEFNFEMSPPLQSWELPLEGLRAMTCKCYQERMEGLLIREISELNQGEYDSTFRHTYSLLFPNLDGKFTIEQFENVVGEIQVKKVPDLINLYRYIQDPFLAISGPGGCSGILEPYYYWPTKRNASIKDDMLYASHLPNILSALSNYVCRSSPFLYQGGDVIVGNDYAIVSERIMRSNLEKYWEGLREISRDVDVQLKKEIANSLGLSHVICPDFDPLTFPLSENDPASIFFHLDLFVTLAGRSTNGKELVFVGKLHEWDGFKWQPVDQDDPRQIYLDNYAIVLERLDHPSISFQVERIPLFFDESRLCSYNNCLVEIDSTGWKRVILPVFGSDPNGAPKYKLADEMAHCVWKSFGFSLKELKGDFVGLAGEKAGLRCIVNVMARQR